MDVRSRGHPPECQATRSVRIELHNYFCPAVGVVPLFIALSVLLSQSKPSYKPSPRVAIAPCRRHGAETAGNGRVGRQAQQVPASLLASTN